MGLRALAYYLDRTEAVVVRSVLSDAGVLAVIGNEDMLRLQPWYTLTFGGYRILVSELQLEEAIAVLEEARVNPLTEGETLSVQGGFVDRVASLILGWLGGGAPTPIRGYSWKD